jgi:hypothetical protein
MLAIEGTGTICGCRAELERIQASAEQRSGLAQESETIRRILTASSSGVRRS